MVLKRYLLVVGLLFSIGKAQELFYTDKHMSNFFVANEQVIVFNNNLFQLMDSLGRHETEALIHEFMDSINLEVTLLSSANPRQLAFNYSNSSVFEPIQWSSVWHSYYEPALHDVLMRQLLIFFDEPLYIAKSIEEAAIIKLAFHDWQNTKNRSTNFSKTRLSISTLSIKVSEFKKTYPSPNLSINRMITGTNRNFYNEAYAVKNLEESVRFVFGPSNKSSLKDCLSMHIYAIQNQSSQVVYLNNHSLICQKDSVQRELDKNWNENVKRAANEIRHKMSSMDISFYSTHDAAVFENLLENYTQEDYLEFQKIYFVENCQNWAFPVEHINSTYQSSILQANVEFKTNTAEFLHPDDSLTLSSLAQFLKANEEVSLVLIGFENEAEYTKVDKKKFKNLVVKYQDSFPVKMSGGGLALYRSLIVFDYLYRQGVNPKRISCVASKGQSVIQQNCLVNWALK